MMRYWETLYTLMVFHEGRKLIEGHEFLRHRHYQQLKFSTPLLAGDVIELVSVAREGCAPDGTPNKTRTLRVPRTFRAYTWVPVVALEPVESTLQE